MWNQRDRDSRSYDRTRRNKEKEKVVLDWPAFQTVKKVQKFLRLINYYQKFVKYYTKIAKLLHKLVRKDQKWI